MLDKKFLLEKINNQQENTQEAIVDRLEAIKKEFFQMAKKRTESANVIDVEPLKEQSNAIQPQLQG
jgi:hypothetical protein